MNHCVSVYTLAAELRLKNIKIMGLFYWFGPRRVGMTPLRTAGIASYIASDVSIFKVYIQQEMTRYSKNVYLFSFFFGVTAVVNAVVLARSRDDNNDL